MEDKNKVIYRRYKLNPLFIKKELESIEKGISIPHHLKEEIYGVKEFLVIDKTYDQLSDEEKQEVNSVKE